MVYSLLLLYLIFLRNAIVATIVTEEGLKIPVFDAAYTDTKGQNVGKIFNNLEILRHSILQAIFDPEELKSLTIVKLDKSNPDSRELGASIHDPENGIKLPNKSYQHKTGYLTSGK